MTLLALFPTLVSLLTNRVKGLSDQASRRKGSRDVAGCGVQKSPGYSLNSYSLYSVLTLVLSASQAVGWSEHSPR